MAAHPTESGDSLEDFGLEFGQGSWEITGWEIGIKM